MAKGTNLEGFRSAETQHQRHGQRRRASWRGLVYNFLRTLLQVTARLQIPDVQVSLLGSARVMRQPFRILVSFTRYFSRPIPYLALMDFSLPTLKWLNVQSGPVPSRSPSTQIQSGWAIASRITDPANHHYVWGKSLYYLCIDLTADVTTEVNLIRAKEWTAIDHVWRRTLFGVVLTW